MHAGRTRGRPIRVRPKVMVRVQDGGRTPFRFPVPMSERTLPADVYAAAELDDEMGLFRFSPFRMPSLLNRDIYVGIHHHSTASV